MPQNKLTVAVAVCSRILFCNGMASGHRENNLYFALWQIKKHTLAGFLVLCVLKMALTIGKQLIV
jgi:hypothetical protein